MRPAERCLEPVASLSGKSGLENFGQNGARWVTAAQALPNRQYNRVASRAGAANLCGLVKQTPKADSTQNNHNQPDQLRDCQRHRRPIAGRANSSSFGNNRKIRLTTGKKLAIGCSRTLRHAVDILRDARPDGRDCPKPKRRHTAYSSKA